MLWRRRYILVTIHSLVNKGNTIPIMELIITSSIFLMPRGDKTCGCQHPGQLTPQTNALSIPPWPVGFFQNGTITAIHQFCLLRNKNWQISWDKLFLLQKLDIKQWLASSWSQLQTWRRRRDRRSRIPRWCSESWSTGTCHLERTIGS